MRARAVDWVRGRRSADPGVRGAFFSGSAVGLPAAAEAPAPEVALRPGFESALADLGWCRRRRADAVLAWLPGRGAVADAIRVAGVAG
ncbi:hypothetical protein AB0I37_27460 [Micromonospora purpureochromogenes]|uniref:hypothetical protein n=1 Tax=Micromonospora purpureochromogenes TaxID=47872 RepID=UPI0033C54604